MKKIILGLAIVWVVIATISANAIAAKFTLLIYKLGVAGIVLYISYWVFSLLLFAIAKLDNPEA